MAAVDTVVIEPALSQALVEDIANVRLIAIAAKKDVDRIAFADRTDTHRAYQLGRLSQLLEGLDEAAFDVLNHAHNGLDVEVSDSQMHANRIK